MALFPSRCRYRAGCFILKTNSIESRVPAAALNMMVLALNCNPEERTFIDYYKYLVCLHISEVQVCFILEH